MTREHSGFDRAHCPRFGTLPQTARAWFEGRMKRLFPIPLILLLSACAAGGSAMDGARTFGSGLGAAATAPLDDLNLRRQYIPTVLLQAESNPYDLRNLNQCAPIGAEVARLNEALGPDLDEPPPPNGQLASEQAAQATAQAALGAVRSAATDFIPGRSWIRRLSGAEQHSRHVQSAVQAGRMRRAFLKGIGMQRNCAPPAAPAWFRPRGGSRR